jgi:transcriptional regulator with XRE-family HTH domain
LSLLKEDDMPTTIKSDVLKFLREKQHWSQEELAHESGVSKRQIQRIEDAAKRAGAVEVRGETLKRLSKAFGRQPGVLTGEIDLPPSGNSHSEQFAAQLAAKLDPHTLLNFELVQARYGASIEDVVHVSTLLFAIYAEEARKVHRRGMLELLRQGAVDYEDLEDESAGHVIGKCEIFGLPESLAFCGEDNAFIEVLVRALASSESGGAGRLETLGDGAPPDSYGMHPGYRVPRVEVCRRELERVTCLDPDATFALTFGAVRLSEIPEELMQVDRAVDRVLWLRERFRASQATSRAGA